MRRLFFPAAACIALGLIFAGCAKKESPSAKEVREERIQETEEEEAEAEEEEAEAEDEEPEAENEEAEAEEEEVKKTPMTEAECRSKIELLRGTQPVHPSDEKLLFEMASCVTVSKVIDQHGVIFSQMDNNKKAVLREQIIDEVMWGDNPFVGAITVEDSNGRTEADKMIPVDEAVAFFKEFYGEDDFTPAQYEHVEDGYILISYGDGEPWHFIEHMQFFEDDNNILASGPAFYEDNGGTIEYLGIADILFSKNPDSRYGATLVYGRYREEKIGVSYVDVSSQLPDANGKTYGGMNLVDDNPSTVWSEGVSGTGVGESFTLHLDGAQPVHGVMICNGYTASYKLYIDNGLLTDVSVDFGSGKTVKGTLEQCAYEGFTPEDFAAFNQNRVELDEPVVTDTVTVTITGAVRGAKYDDTCVSGVIVY